MAVRGGNFKAVKMAQVREEVECPVCSRSFLTWMINGHIEQCLSSSAEEEDSQNMKDLKIIGFNSNKKSTSSRKSPGNQESSTKSPSFSSPPAKKTKVESENLSYQGRAQTAVKNASKSRFVPLAEKLRPCSLAEYVGQTHVVGDNCILKNLLQSDEIPSMIFWGPPGCGKTTLANIIANNSKKNANEMRFVKLSATMAGVAEVKDVIKVAKNEQTIFKRKTILFVDEIHRFNKLQQDTFLPHVENGTIILLGATTENPSFHVNSALLSRCRVIVLQKLSAEDIVKILKHAVHTLGGEVHEDKENTTFSSFKEKRNFGRITVKQDSLMMLASLCDGDARNALNALEMAFQSKCSSSKPGQLDSDKPCLSDITVDDIKESFQRSHVSYDKNGEEHYNIISALHKSVRGSNENAALYWLGRMLVGGEEPLYIARRLVRMASEDIGLADPMALNQAVSAFQACHFIGQPECDVILAQATVYLARAPKSVEVYKAYGRVVEHIKSYQGTLPGVPLHLRNAPTKLLKELGYGKGYKYNPDYEMPVDQEYLPEELKGINFFSN